MPAGIYSDPPLCDFKVQNDDKIVFLKRMYLLQLNSTKIEVIKVT